MKFRKSLSLLIVIILLFSFAMTTSAASNMLIEQRADPHIYKHTDGYYYYTASVPEYDRIILRRATTIQGLATAPETVIWWKHSSGEMSAHIWAPEIHHINGKWYVYFAAGRTDDVWAIRQYVLESSSANPLTGTWVEKGKVQMNFESFTLDATTFVHNNQRYLAWAQKVGSDSNIYIAAMSDPWTISGNQVMISTPQYSWETQGYRVNEAPSVIKRNGRIFMSYSASATDDRYCLGLLTASDTSNLLDANSWSKSPNPVFSSSIENSQYGPGHNSFTISEDGSSDILVYHACPYKEISGDPLYDPNRHTHVQQLNWNSDGTPNFGVPGEGTGGGLVSGNTYNLVNVASGKALDVWNMGTANGTNVAIYTLYNNAAQKWTIYQNSDGTYKLINPNSGKALDVDGFGTANGTNVQIWQDYNNAAQKWSIIQNADGSYRLINPNSNKALDAAGTTNGSNALIWDYWGGSNQHWNIVPAN